MAGHYRKLNRVLLAGFVLASGQWLVACGSLGAGSSGATFREPAMSMQKAQAIVVVDHTTQAQTRVALGPATEVQFDSGYSVWVYRGQKTATSADRAEFVILFGPSGIVKKTRLRPAYAALVE